MIMLDLDILTDNEIGLPVVVPLTTDLNFQSLLSREMVKALVDNLSTLINPCRVLLIAACVGFLCNYNYSKG